ncbi:myb-related transcription factor, partner of profilin [Syngnathoides biaculeatus]|uniref:myb-related transcription factor, partner of profilin n=1 Tax=Syngnathoides biaculeatus TaxID=300417 RepID=UPI002ADD7F5A|nr:myb-related transcription factor, partner of profilin [Syngnathoides biaculeatus]XP_061688599.1 myb-related transcription factor, partner of profilin [Syngnathoides biaculeatus]
MTERRQPNFSQEETDLLIREVEARKERLYGTASRAPRPDEVKLAWKEITSILNESNHGLLRTAAQYKKRFNDVRRRAKNKLCCIRKEQQQGTRGGAAATACLSPLEELVASIPTVSREGFGGVEVGVSGQPVGKKDGFFEPAPSAESRAPAAEEADEPKDDAGVDGSGEELADGSGDAPDRRPSGRRRGRERGDRPFLDLQRGGFEMLERELSTLNSHLRSLQSGVLPLLASIDGSLRRIADAAERLAPQPAPGPRGGLCQEDWADGGEWEEDRGEIVRLIIDK